MDLDLEKPVMPQLRHVGIDKNIPELMDFSCFDDLPWRYIVIYFRVAIMTYYRNKFSRAELKKAGLGDNAVSSMRKCAREEGLDYSDFNNFQPYVRAYIERFQHMLYRPTLQKFKSDFVYYAWRESGYNLAKVCKKHKVTDHAARRWLNEAIGRKSYT